MAWRVSERGHGVRDAGAIKKQRPRDALGKGEPLSSVEDAEESGVNNGPGHRGVDTPLSHSPGRSRSRLSGMKKKLV
jgi:hypothetical protein